MQMYFRILAKGKADERTAEYQSSFDEVASSAPFEDKEFVPDEYDQPSASRSIEEDFGDTIKNKIIVRDEGGGDRRANCFWVHDTPQSLYSMIVPRGASAKALVPALHEVALPGLPRKLFFDFDFGAEHFVDLLQGVAPDANSRPRIRAIVAALVAADFSGQQSASPILPEPVVADLRRTYDDDKIHLGGYSLYSDPDDKLRRVVGHVLLRHFMRFLALAFGRNCYLLHCQSSTTASAKFSAHLIVGAYASNYHDVAEVAMLLHQRFAAQDEVAYLASRFLDMGVYKSLQNLRITGCKKPNTTDDRKKVLVVSPWDDPFDAWRHTLVTQIDGETDLKLAARFDSGRLTSDTYSAAIKGRASHAELPANLIARLGEYAQGFRVDRIIDNLVTFRRMGASPPCAFCQRTHDKDNTLLVTLIHSSVKGAAPTLLVQCRRDLSHRKIVLAPA